MVNMTSISISVYLTIGLLLMIIGTLWLNIDKDEDINYIKNLPEILPKVLLISAVTVIVVVFWLPLLTSTFIKKGE